MLRYLDEHDAAWRIRNAIDKVYRDKSKRTRDVGGAAGTSEFADAIIEAMAAEPESAAPEPVSRQAAAQNRASPKLPPSAAFQALYFAAWFDEQARF
jgi:hypothetical protein